jgi:hypothetical protein
MKLIDGLKNLKGRPVEIPDCSRDDLPQLFLEMGFKVGAEIGVDRGEFSEVIAKSGLKLYSVDPWFSYEDYEHTRGQDELNSLYERTKKRLAPYSNCTIVRKNSMDAAKDFEDGSLDFVYIDGNHQFKYVAEDICEWAKKVKVGGIICGHDYIYTDPRTQAGICHVIYVLNAYTKAYKIENWYLLGTKDRVEGEKRDRFRSWMFINKAFEFRKDE